MIQSNTLQVRRVMQREVDADGNASFHETLQFRTRDVLVAVLGVSLGSWSAWQSIPRTDLIYVDEEGSAL